MAKHKIADKVQGWHRTIFRVEKVLSTEKDILIHFGHPVKYQVVKLSVKDLPPKDLHDKKIHWFNNFAIVDSAGRYVKRVKYTVFLPTLPKTATFIYYEHGHLKSDKKPKHTGSKPPRPHMVQVDLDSGDPGIGCR